MRWMNLEPIRQSEVSQKEKDKYHILMHIYEIYKNGTKEFIYRAAIKKQTWKGGGPKLGEEQDGETTFSPTNSSKDHLNTEQIPQNNF